LNFSALLSFKTLVSLDRDVELHVNPVTGEAGKKVIAHLQLRTVLLSNTELLVRETE
jgi:hypothetical protein